MRHRLTQHVKLNGLFVPNSVHVLHGGKHGTHCVPDTVWEDSHQYLLRASPPSQLVHVQPERSRNHFQPFGNCRSSQVTIRTKLESYLALSICPRSFSLQSGSSAFNSQRLCDGISSGSLLNPKFDVRCLTCAVSNQVNRCYDVISSPLVPSLIPTVSPCGPLKPGMQPLPTTASPVPSTESGQ